MKAILQRHAVGSLDRSDELHPVPSIDRETSRRCKGRDAAAASDTTRCDVTPSDGLEAEGMLVNRSAAHRHAEVHNDSSLDVHVDVAVDWIGGYHHGPRLR